MLYRTNKVESLHFSRCEWRKKARQLAGISPTKLVAFYFIAKKVL